MTELTAPFDPRVTTALTASLRHVHHVYALDPSWDDPLALELDLIDATLTYDEENSPFVTFSGTFAVPEDQAVLDALDPRVGVVIEVWAGYQYGPGRQDVHRLGSLRLHRRIVNRPQNTMTLEAASDELRVIDWTPLGQTKSYPYGTTPGFAIRDLIRWVLPGAPVTDTLTAVDPFVEVGDSYAVTTGEDVWDAIQDIADRAGAWVYHDGDGRWFIRNQPARTGPTVASLRVGDAGTITSSETAFDYADFANAVLVSFEWFDGEDRQERTGWAEIVAGPLGTGTIGRKTKTVTIERKGSTTQARAAATTMVRRAVSRGRSMSLEAANAAYWLRPGDTVTVQLPTGPQERHLASRVDFGLPAGTVHVRTRVPDDVTITTGE